MSEGYDLVVKGRARRALAEELPPFVAFAAWEFIDGHFGTIHVEWESRWSNRFRGIGPPDGGTTGSGTESTKRNA